MSFKEGDRVAYRDGGGGSFVVKSLRNEYILVDKYGVEFVAQEDCLGLLPPELKRHTIGGIVWEEVPLVGQPGADAWILRKGVLHFASRSSSTDDAILRPVHFKEER